MCLLIVGNIVTNVHDHDTLTETLIFFQKRFLEIGLLVLRISVFLRLLINTAKYFSRKFVSFFFLPKVEYENAHFFKYPAIHLPYFNLHCLLPVKSNILPFVYISHFQTTYIYMRP